MPTIVEYMATTVKIGNECPCCEGVWFVIVKCKNFKQWKSGVPVGHAFPFLTSSEQRIFTNGICEECWVEP